MDSDSEESWVEEFINYALKFGAELVEEDHYKARAEICNSCPYQGEVFLSNMTAKKVIGCTICQCPTKTKPKYKKYFSFAKLRIIEASCPDQVDRWEQVDNHFFNKNKLDV